MVSQPRAGCFARERRASIIAQRPLSPGLDPEACAWEDFDAGRGDDSARRRERVRAPGCGRGLEGHRREPASGSWNVAQLAGSGKTQVTRQDRASCGLE